MFASDAEMMNVLKKLKIKVYSHYLGTANIQSEKFYILKIYMTMEHPDESFLDEIDEMSFTMHALIHATSGYNIQMDGESYPVCTIYKQDKELVKIDTETMARVAGIRFNNGTKEIIPRANLEVILSD